ncbi:MAG: hypothetical protein AAF915_11005 [Cyanobacteria bacterium P01_D01_bin.50]
MGARQFSLSGLFANAVLGNDEGGNLNLSIDKLIISEITSVAIPKIYEVSQVLVLREILVLIRLLFYWSLWLDLRTALNRTEETDNFSTTNSKLAIVKATEWMKGKDGELYLVAENNAGTGIYNKPWNQLASFGDIGLKGEIIFIPNYRQVYSTGSSI